MPAQQPIETPSSKARYLAFLSFMHINISVIATQVLPIYRLKTTQIAEVVARVARQLYR